MKKNKVAILLFHRVLPVRDVMWDPIDPARFEFILRFLKKNYTVLPLLEILDSTPAYTKKPLAAVTFDDGYRDFIDYSVPIMDRLKIPSSMYIVTDCISNDKPTWTFEMDYLFFNTHKLQIHWSFDISFLPRRFRKNKFANKKELIAFCLEFKQYIKIIAEENRKILIQDLFRSFNDVTVPGGLMMNWNDVNQIINAGIEVGSHTVTHPPLTTISKPDLERELQWSKSEYFKHTGKDPRVIAYPVGSCNEQVKKSATLAGYNYGLALNNKIYDPRTDDKFEIPRIELYNESFGRTWLRIKQFG